MSSPLTRTICLFALLVLLAVLSCSAAKSVDSFDFGKAKTLDTMADYQQVMATSSKPALCFFFPTNDMAAVESTWAPHINSIALAVGELGISTYYFTTDSEVGKAVLGGENRPYIQLIDTVPRRVENSWSKISSVYVGSFNAVEIIRWVIESVSPEMIDRVDNPRDLLEYLQLYPAYPKLPRILLFTSRNYVGPVFKVLSQALYTEAVFGAVVSPFTTKDKTAVAEMYGIKKSDLPAMVVLYPQNSGDADEVKRVPGITADSALEDILKALQPMLPDALENLLIRTPQEERDNLLMAQGKKKNYIATVHDTRRAKVDAQRSQNEAPKPTVLASNKMWNSMKQELAGHQVFLAFAEHDEVEKISEILYATTKRIFKEIPSVAREGRVAFFIIEGTSHHEINQFFGVDESNFPQLVFIDASSPQFKFYNHVAAFNEDRILHFYITKGADALAVGGKQFKAADVPSFTANSDDTDDVADL